MTHTFLFVGEKTTWSTHLDEAISSFGKLWIVQEDALETAVSQRHYDLALIDASHVPNVPKLIVRLRRQQSDMHVVVVAQTRPWKRAQEALEAGATNYILKSEDSRKIREEIRSTLEKPLPILQNNQKAETPQNIQEDQVKLTILLADNYRPFAETRSEFLKREGYKVLLAFNPLDAKTLLEKGGIDLAVLDVRMADDDDDEDISGLTIAKTVAPSIPKIMLTGFPTVKVVEAIISVGKPTVVNLLSKKEGPEKLINAILETIGRPDESKSVRKDLDPNAPSKLNHPPKMPNKKSTALLVSFFIFVTLPKTIGRFILDMFGRDKATDTTALLLGYTVALLVVLIVKGIINPDDILNVFTDIWHFFFPLK